MKKMERLIKLLLLGGIFCSVYSITEATGAILDLTYEPDFLYGYLALILLGSIIAILCAKFYIPFLRFIVFAILFMLSQCIWLWIVFQASSELDRIFWQMLKGGIFFISGALLHRGTALFKQLGSLWPGLLFVSGPLLLSELYWKAAFLKERLMVISVFFLLFAIFKQGLEQTHFLFTARGVDLPEVRKRVVYRGLLTAACLFGLILAVTNLKGVIWFLICAIAEGLEKFVLWLFSLFPKHREGSPPPEGFGFMPFDPRPSPYPLVVFLLYFASSFAGLSLLYWVLTRAGPALKRLVRIILRWLSGWFVSKKSPEGEGGEEFTDTVEAVEKKMGKKPAGRRFSLPDLLQRLKAESNPVYKVRICYQIILIGLSEQLRNISTADTTGDICRKASAVMKMSEEKEMLEKATGLYDRVRYGSGIPEESEVEEIRQFASAYVIARSAATKQSHGMQ